MTEDFDDLSESDENVREFFETHGAEGLFVLFFKNFIYRFVLQELKSPSEDIDGAQRILFSKSSPDAPSPTHQELKDQCDVWGRDLVDYLKEDPLLAEIIDSGDLSRLEDEAVEERVREAMHERFEKWAEQSEDLLNEVEDEL